jgi:hypothetical protein
MIEPSDIEPLLSGFQIIDLTAGAVPPVPDVGTIRFSFASKHSIDQYPAFQQSEQQHL